jgi:DNA polymerase-3 subunit beta
VHTVDADDLAIALVVVTAINRDRGPAIKLAMSAAGELTVSANNPELGSASERVGCIYRGDALEIGFNSNYLAEIIGKVAPSGKRKVGEDRHVTIRLSDAGGPVLITGPIGPMTVLMPMRV